jgi:hypothetical protein
MDPELLGRDLPTLPPRVAPPVSIDNSQTQLTARRSVTAQLLCRGSEIIGRAIEGVQQELVIGNFGREQKHLRIERSHI